MIRFRSFTLVAGVLLAACTAPAATPTPVPPTTAPAATAQTAQPTIAATQAAVATNPPTATAPTSAPTQAAAQPTQQATSAPTVVVPPLDRTLALEQPLLEGQDVRTLQERLLELGYRQLGTADGIFGANTETAVRAFQTLNRLEVDGIVGPNTWALLYAPEVVGYDLHPIVDTQRGFLIGAANGSGWVESIIAAKLLGETEYQLLSRSDVLVATGSAPEPPQGPPCEDTRFVEFGSPVAEDRPIALAADWNTLPRPATEVPTDTAALEAPVAIALRVLGLADPQVRVTRVLRADLDGDGDEETILAATYRASGLDFPQPSAQTGDYSALFVLPDGATAASVIAADVITADVEFGAPLEFQLLGLWDLNGDGTLEIAATGDYYEGGSTSIYTLDGTATKEVLISGCGV